MSPQLPESRRLLRFELRELTLIALGAVPGALLRWQIEERFGPSLGNTAGADLLVNLLGSFLLGMLAGSMPRRPDLLLFAGIGFCGSLTTFSSWMLEVVRLAESSQPWRGLALLLVSLVLGLAAVWLGLAGSGWLWGRAAGIRPPGRSRWRR